MPKIRAEGGVTDVTAADIEEPEEPAAAGSVLAGESGPELELADQQGVTVTPQEPDGGSELAEPGPVQPARNASQADWATYAVAVDPDLGYDQAAAMTRAELIERYG